MTAIIDYDAGNLGSVEKALHYLGDNPVITRDREEILKADRVILPGVGAFGDAMRLLNQYGLPDTIRQAVSQGTPFLGIGQLFGDRRLVADHRRPMGSLRPVPDERHARALLRHPRHPLTAYRTPIGNGRLRKYDPCGTHVFPVKR